VVKLVDTDIKTREVTTWSGLHLLNFSESSCSQKTRIALNLKKIKWTSHSINLGLQENYSPWFLGINPRGLVPVLVHDGEVHIESNDILYYLDDAFPDRKLIPSDQRTYIEKHLSIEDELHMDVRTLTMRFIVPGFLSKKSKSKMSSYKNNQGTVSGEEDYQKEAELKFWKDFQERGITDEQVIASFTKFREVYNALNSSLKTSEYLAGDEPNLMDIAWFIYTDRLSNAGYPFSKLHPNIFTWYTNLKSREDFSKEVRSNFLVKLITRTLALVQKLSKRTLEDIVKISTGHHSSGRNTP